ncbi:MAG TPA: DNA-deoxyinosine glycosylase [Solimonas sp.]
MADPTPAAQCASFPPAARADAIILILGSMPGIASLRAQQYYAHPRNLFWPFMAEILGVPADADYTTRLAQLQAQGIAIWDVLAACERPGSLDGRIVRASEVANDFAGFLAQHRRLQRICLNGGKAAEAFVRHVQRPRPSLLAGREIIRLPSTSPANAGQSRAIKLAQWRAGLRCGPPAEVGQ